jgi:PII-like signaling protein
MHLSEHDRCDGIPLYKAVANVCQTLGIAGITVFRGAEGYGESAELRHRRILAHDQPIIVTIVDTAENIDRLMPELGKMIDTGVVAISDVEMIRIEGGNAR